VDFENRTNIPNVLEILNFNFHREAHLQKKIDALTAEAKAKLAKKDKKGKHSQHLQIRMKV